MNDKVKEMLKIVDKFNFSHNRHELLSDCFECFAICISNLVDKPQFAAREKRYLEIVSKYSKSELDTMAELFATIWEALTQMPQTGIFDDYLGQLYMASDTGNKKAGQYFTPYDVSKISAELAIEHKQIDTKKDIITMYEPACGSGGMILAFADVLQTEHQINYAAHSFVLAGDIDSRCVHMCYIQLSLAGIPAIIEQRNALTMELLGGIWKTPAYLFQWLRFKDITKREVILNE